MSEVSQLQRQLKEINAQAHRMRMMSCDYLAADLEKHAERLRKQIRIAKKDEGIIDEETGQTRKVNHFSFWQRLRLLFTGKVPIREETQDQL